MIFFLSTLLRFYYSNQTLTLTRFSDRHDQPATDLQLRNQRLRNRWTTSSNKDSIVRRVCRPTERAVKTLHRRVVDPELANARLGPACEIADSFDRINLGRNFR